MKNCEHNRLEFIGTHKDNLEGVKTPLYRCLECRGVIEAETLERYRGLRKHPAWQRVLYRLMLTVLIVVPMISIGMR